MPDSPYCRCGKPFVKPDAFLVCEACWAKLSKRTQDLLVQYSQTEQDSARFRAAVAAAMAEIDAA